MTEEKIYKMAYMWAIHIWSGWYDKLGKSPNIEIYQDGEKEAWKEVKELDRLIEKQEAKK